MKRATILILLLAACEPAPVAPPAAAPVSVILMIGDGMGPSQVTLAQLFQEAPLALDTIEVTGFVRTHSADQLVTDSAAAATALACGVKTNNGMVGMNPDGKAVGSILETYQRRGYAVGLVSTARITHATPAAFGAHVTGRELEPEIAAQYAKSGINVLMGGGGAVIDAGAFEGYSVVKTRDELAAVKGGRILGIFSDSHMPYVLDRGPEAPTLKQMTEKAIEALSPGPFFLMIEGGRIDHAAHAYDAAGVVHQMREFDAAVKVVLDFARKRKDVLVVVTADHATGGLAINEKITTRQAHLARVKASAEIMADRVAAAEDRRAALLKELAENAAITDATDAEIDEVLGQFGDPPFYEAGNRIGTIISRRIGVTFIPNAYRTLPPDTLYGHDGTMVPVYAFGEGAERFSGTMDNIEIPKRILGP